MPKICKFHCQKLILSVLLLCFSYPGACFEKKKNPLKTAAAGAARCILNNWLNFVFKFSFKIKVTNSTCVKMPFIDQSGCEGF